MAVLASPTPGNITLSAVASFSGSSVISGSTPRRFSALVTEITFPALYFTMTVLTAQNYIKLKEFTDQSGKYKQQPSFMLWKIIPLNEIIQSRYFIHPLKYMPDLYWPLIRLSEM